MRNAPQPTAGDANNTLKCGRLSPRGMVPDFSLLEGEKNAQMNLQQTGSLEPEMLFIFKFELPP